MEGKGRREQEVDANSAIDVLCFCIVWVLHYMHVLNIIFIKQQKIAAKKKVLLKLCECRVGVQAVKE